MKRLILTLVFCILSSALHAQGSDMPNSHDEKQQGEMTTQPTLTNESFVNKLATSIQAEIDLSNLALSRTQNTQIKSFAEKIVRDHTRAGKRLRSIAQSKKIPFPNQTDKVTTEELSKSSIAEFDKAYGDQIRKDHEEAVSLITAAASDESLDPELRQFASKVLPTLREHQQEAQNLP